MSSIWGGDLIALLTASPVVAWIFVMVRRFRSLGPAPMEIPGASGPGRSPDAGVREPRRPKPTAGAGAMALQLPPADDLEDAG